jgi:aspartate/methionine/tyrosine aminotransferase
MVSRRLESFGTTVFAAMSARAAEVGAVNLGQGFPDFEGPGWLLDELGRAAREHPNQYAPTAGLPELREAIAERWHIDTGCHADPEREITVTTGATEAMAAACLGLLDPGDKVVVFEPYYDAYRAALAMAGAEGVFVPLHRRDDGSFAFDIAELRDAVARPGVRAVLVNTPHNPTGKVFDAEELAEIARLCVAHDRFAITDEVYERLLFDGATHTNLATLDGMRERTLTISSLGKTMSVTGWKIGWAIAPPELTAGVRAAHQYLTFSVNTPAQHAAARALREGEPYWRSLAHDLARRRDTLAQTLAGLGFRFATPKSGYFILADHTAVSGRLGLEDDIALCEHLIEHAGVVAIPPTAFYERQDLGKPLIRFAFCKKGETIEEASRRLRGNAASSASA